ncbi:DUF1737 domain-containing protein [Helicobacter pullorum]|uniref:DUF1737 domain-containing protein n=1 Tax=Helicobacter pullorum TaxID=35818 RepID=UPI0024320A33|nr:DUF1737 domain-containing protein [Helicobacter pullorum]HEH5010505.1 DUF1737 domain-containing protein [Campylobacter coli]HEH5040490.1 DUF1737 domain-containing protein [Campylobacter coli]HEH5151509.1 DUF1737 domain-containing protein [Campylobacter coli]HEH5389242.1 DUF1737 domain-containing protein [Campylobacter coli]HEH5417785.1 DUF1737 domain-containing protein [Campylobacter coli]
MEIEKYEVILSNDSLAFQQMVNYYLKNGWQLVGGVSVTASKNYLGNEKTLYSQAVIKIKKEQ